jgi:hypothetical protein
LDLFQCVGTAWILFRLEGKAVRQTKGGANPFIDTGELGRHLAEMEKDLEQALQSQERRR